MLSHYAASVYSVSIVVNEARPVPPRQLPQSAEPRTSVVVLGWREAPYLLNCLESLCRQDGSSGSFEVIVFLNEPSAALWERVQQGVRGARVMSSPANLGFGGGNNAAAEAARGEFVVFLNDDAEAAPGWLGALIEAADSYPEAGAIGSVVLAWHGTVQEAGGVVDANGQVTPLLHGQPGDDATRAEVREVDFVSGCALLVRRTAWLALRGFDPGYYPAYYEDVDLCLRLRSRGWRILCAGSSVVRHRHSASVMQRYKDFLLQRNRLRLLERLADGDLGRPADAESSPRTGVEMEAWDTRAVAALRQERDVLRDFTSHEQMAITRLSAELNTGSVRYRELEHQFVEHVEAEAALAVWARELETRLVESERRLAENERRLAGRLQRLWLAGGRSGP